MENIQASSNSLKFVDNSTINFTGLCTTNTFDVSERIFSQDVINDYITLPSNKIPIKEINSINIENTILNYKVMESPGASRSNFIINNEKKRMTGIQLSVFGSICLNITYTGSDTAATNQEFLGKLPFTSYIILPKTTILTDKFDISCCIQKINIISIDDSLINVSASFTVSAKKNPNPPVIIPSNCTCSNSSPLTITGTTSGNVLKTLIAPQDKLWNQVSFSRNLIIPAGLPAPKSVTSISSSIKIISQKVVETAEMESNATNFRGQVILGKKLTIELILKQRITYTANNASSSSHSLIVNVPISCYIILLKETNLNQEFEIGSYIEDLHSCSIDESSLFTGAIIFLKAIEKNCIPINIATGCCNSFNYFDLQHNVTDICNFKGMPPLKNRSTWSEVVVSKRISAIPNAPVHFIKNSSISLKIISTNVVTTPRSVNNPSYEGFLLSGVVAIIDGYLITNITYNSRNTDGSVIGLDIKIPFSAFIVLIEKPNAISKLVVTPCIEKCFASVLDDNGIGVYAQLFFNADVVRVN